MKKRTFPEQELQRSIVEFLRLALGSHFRILHIPNEGERSAGAHGAMVGSGMVQGAPDLLVYRKQHPLWGRPFFGFIEVKVPGRRLTKAQIVFRDDCESMNIPWGLACSIEDAAEIARGWGLEVRASVR